MPTFAFRIVMLLGALIPLCVHGAGFAVQLQMGGEDGKAEVQNLHTLPSAPSQGALAFSEDAWSIELVDAADQVLVRHAIPSPRRAASGFMPGRIPTLIQFPDHASAVRADLHSEDGRLVATIDLGSVQRSKAQQRAVAVASGESAPATTRSKTSSSHLHRQIEFEARGAFAGAQECRRRHPLLPPEAVLSSEGCEASAVQARLPSARARADGPRREVRDVDGSARGQPVARSVPAVEAKRSLRGVASTSRLSGRIRFPAGATPPSDSVEVLVDGFDGTGATMSIQAAPPEFRYGIDIKTGASVALDVRPPYPFLPARLALGVISTDVVRDLDVVAGLTVSGRLVFPHYQPVPTTPIDGSLRTGSGNRFFTLSPPDFRFAAALEPGQKARLRIESPVPYLTEDRDLGAVFSDRELTVMMRRGQVFSGVVRVRSEANPWVRIDASGTLDEPGAAMGVQRDRPFQFAVAPGSRFVEASADGFQPDALAVPPGGDFEGELVLVPEAPSDRNVRLQFKWDNGRPVTGARAEIWRGDDFLSSGFATGAENSTDAGLVQMSLADGDYTLRLWPTSQYNAPYFPLPMYSRPALVQSLTVRGDTSATFVVPTAETNRMRVEMTLPPNLPGCDIASVFGRIELLEEGKVVARSDQLVLAVATPGGRSAVDLLLGSGRHQVRIVLQGNMQATTPPFVASQGLVVQARPFSPARFLRGVLRDHQGRPLADRRFSAYDDLGGPMNANQCAYGTDGLGRFALPLCEGCGFQLPDEGDGTGARHFLRISGKVDADRHEDIQLAPGLPLAAVAASGTTRIWGDPQAPLRIVFLAEGYAAERESYTDRNGNGLWDGVLWVDVDGDGLYDDGEPATTYGAASFPVAGSDPRTANEPFVDLNGDGVPSFDDRALFERNVQDYLRGLFSTDVFGAYRHAYQAHAVMAFSNQVGMDHGAQWQRDTRFNASFVPDRGLISVDYGRAQAEASAALPGFDVVVVMINQPVPYGRVNAFILASGGMKASARNDLVGAHEFGHKIGGLADEYWEYPHSRFVGADPGGRNSSRFLRRSMVGWGAMLPVETPARPSPDFMPGVGLFEGSSYVQGGVFRPTMYSLMRYLEPWFNAPSKVHLDRVHVPALSGRPGRLAVVDVGDCRRMRVTWDVAADRVTQVVVRRGSDRGDVLTSGGERGALDVDVRSSKGALGDLVLIDAATGAVLDIESAPMVRCRQ